MKPWYERAEEEIYEEYENGNITDKELRSALKELQQEYDQYAQEDAQNTYDSWY